MKKWFKMLKLIVAFCVISYFTCAQNNIDTKAFYYIEKSDLYKIGHKKISPEAYRLFVHNFFMLKSLRHDTILPDGQHIAARVERGPEKLELADSVGQILGYIKYKRRRYKIYDPYYNYLFEIRASKDGKLTAVRKSFFTRTGKWVVIGVSGTFVVFVTFIFIVLGNADLG